MESDFKKTRIYELMQRSNAAWEAHRREERELEEAEARKRAEKRAQRGTFTPAADPNNGHPVTRPTDMRTVTPLSQVFCTELVIGTLIVD